MTSTKLLKQTIGSMLIVLLVGCSEVPSGPTATPTQVPPVAMSTLPPPTAMPASPTATPIIPPTATSAPVTAASSLEELGTFIGTQAQHNLTSADSEAQVLQVSTQDDGSLFAIVVDEQAEAFDGIALAFAAAIYTYREDPLMPDTFSVLVLDSPSIITGKARGLGTMRLSDVTEWGQGNIDADEFIDRIDFRTE